MIFWGLLKHELSNMASIDPIDSTDLTFDNAIAKVKQFLVAYGDRFGTMPLAAKLVICNKDDMEIPTAVLKQLIKSLNDMCEMRGVIEFDEKLKKNMTKMFKGPILSLLPHSKSEKGPKEELKEEPNERELKKEESMEEPIGGTQDEFENKPEDESEDEFDEWFKGLTFEQRLIKAVKAFEVRLRIEGLCGITYIALFFLQLVPSNAVLLLSSLLKEVKETAEGTMKVSRNDLESLDYWALHCAMFEIADQLREKDWPSIAKKIVDQLVQSPFGIRAEVLNELGKVIEKGLRQQSMPILDLSLDEL